MKEPFSSGRSFGNEETRGHVSARPVPVLCRRAIARAPVQVTQGSPTQAVCSPARCWHCPQERNWGLGEKAGMLQASAAVRTLSPDRGTLCQLAASWGLLVVGRPVSCLAGEADERAGFRSPPTGGAAPLMGPDPAQGDLWAIPGPSVPVRCTCLAPALLRQQGPERSQAWGAACRIPIPPCGGRGRETCGEEAGVQALVGVGSISDRLLGVPEPSSWDLESL